MTQKNKDDNIKNERIIEDLRNKLTQNQELIQLKMKELTELKKNVTELNRDRFKENYMELNDKYASVLLELNALKMQNINRETQVQNELQTQTIADDVFNIVNDFSDNIMNIDDIEYDENNKDELDEYLKRVQYIHNQLDSNLLHITKSTISSDIISESESEESTEQ